MIRVVLQHFDVAVGCATEPVEEVLGVFVVEDDAIHEAYENGLIGDNDLELAWRTGADPLKLAGFTNSAVTA